MKKIICLVGAAAVAIFSLSSERTLAQAPAISPAPAAAPAAAPAGPAVAPTPSLLPTTPPTAPQGAQAMPPQGQPPQGAFEVPTGFFYYCAKSNAYFPTVENCPEGWIAIPVSNPVPVGRWGELPSRDTPEEAVRSRPNAFTLELLGRALLYSIDYDRALSPYVTLGVGFSTWQLNSWWNNYNATVTVVPIYANFYFSDSPNRGYLSAGADWISVSQTGWNSNTFANNGFAATAGGGYEARSNSGFIFRLGVYIIVGQSATVQPAFNIGYAF